MKHVPGAIAVLFGLTVLSAYFYIAGYWSGVKAEADFQIQIMHGDPHPKAP